MKKTVEFLMVIALDTRLVMVIWMFLLFTDSTAHCMKYHESPPITQPL